MEILEQERIAKLEKLAGDIRDQELKSEYLKKEKVDIEEEEERHRNTISELIEQIKNEETLLEQKTLSIKNLADDESNKAEKIKELSGDIEKLELRSYALNKELENLLESQQEKEEKNLFNCRRNKKSRIAIRRKKIKLSKV